VELGLTGIAVEDFTFMGMWDHFYNNSILGQDISTHYVNLPHYIVFESRPVITMDDQHGEFEWFELSLVSDDENFNVYMRNYASWLLNKKECKND
jgi:colanic acid biosynthesis protein WcaH